MKAFPIYGQNPNTHGGMDLRDYFAAKAMPAIVINKEVHKTIFEMASKTNKTPEEYLAFMSYAIADAMMKTRGK